MRIINSPRTRMYIAITAAVLLAVLSWWFFALSGSRQIFNEALLGEIAQVTQATLNGDGHDQPGSKYLSRSDGPVYVALRQNGTRVSSKWEQGDSNLDSLIMALEKAGGLTTSSVDTVEICFSNSYVSTSLGSGDLTNVHRGVLGIEARHGGNTGRYSPTLMLEQNWSFMRVLEQFSRAHGVPDLSDIELAVFKCDQVLVGLEGEVPTAEHMFRGNSVVELEAVTHANVAAVGDGMAAWMENNLNKSGRMLYKYWPSRQAESDANNMIRQWMATVALNRSGADAALTKQNIRYNLDSFYSQENGFGLINEGSQVKLGAVALAALAIKEHPNRDEFKSYEQALQRTIEHLHQPDGSFRTFYRPADRNDNQNFYPGEALLYWAELYLETKDPKLLSGFMKSFEYYRQWHLDQANRNPAFIPWHTQAYYQVWRETGDSELSEFILLMNDWLVDLQEWDESLYPDTRGRFYDSDRPHFGVPHSSSTGVYLEGLVDAYKLAIALDERKRAEVYRVAIIRGLRSIMQLQFRNDADMYYITEPKRVKGGVRTTVYDNEIRVDNVQHNLMAILKILDAFDTSDFEI